MLTMFKRLASLVPTPASSKVTLFVSDTGIPSYKDDAGLVTPLSGQPIPAGYIDGLKMEYVAPGQVRFTSGSAYIPSLGRALASASALTKTLTLTASTWYYAYLYSNAGVADVEAVTTTPDTPYNGTARTKTGDPSRRYLGAFKTDASGAIIAFDNLPSGLMLYRIPSANFGNFQILAGGAATTPTDLDCSPYIPATAKLGYFQLQINGGTLTNLAPSGLIASPVADLVVTRGSSIGIYIGACRIGLAQKVAYQAGDSSSTTFVWIKGYYEER